MDMKLVDLSSENSSESAKMGSAFCCCCSYCGFDS